MRDYEMVVILSPEIADENLTATVDKISQSIVQKGGVVNSTSNMGKLKLAFPIKRKMEGNYFLTQFKLEPKHTKALEDGLKLTDEVLRYLVIKLD